MEASKVFAHSAIPRTMPVSPVGIPNYPVHVKEEDTPQGAMDDTTWRCSECGRFALKRRFADGKTMCSICWSERESISPSESEQPVESAEWRTFTHKKFKKLDNCPQDGGDPDRIEEGDDTLKGMIVGSVPDISINGKKKVAGDVGGTPGDSSRGTQDQNCAVLGASDEGNRPHHRPIRVLRLKVTRPLSGGGPDAREGSESSVETLAEKGDIPAKHLRPSVLRPRIRTSGRNIPADEMANAVQDVAEIPKEDMETGIAGLCNGGRSDSPVMSPITVSVKSTADGSAGFPEQEDDYRFSPGQLVWAGGRGYQGGVWDPWPGRVVDHKTAKLLEVGSVPSNRRLVMLFGRNPENDRRYVVMAVTALRPYVPDRDNVKRKFRDPRGRLACTLANACGQVYGRDHCGPVDEDRLLPIVKQSELEIGNDVLDKEAKKTYYDFTPPGQSLKERRQRVLADERGERRKRRTAAVNNKFCASAAEGRDLSQSPIREARKSGFAKMPSASTAGVLHRKRKVTEPLEAARASLEIRDGEACAAPVSLRTKRTRLASRLESRDVGDDSVVEQLARGEEEQSPKGDMPAEALLGQAVRPTGCQSPVDDRSRLDFDISRLGFKEVAGLMARFITEGYPDADKDVALRVLTEGCVRYKLNGRSLLSRQPCPEDIVVELLGKQTSGSIGASVVPRDGFFWAAVEFITLARTQKLRFVDLVSHLESPAIRIA